jgi:hypothetical protein
MNTRVLNEQPWRFNPGRLVYVRGWPADERGKVTAWIQNRAFPHYLVVDSVGIEWQVAQIELSSKPIPQE